MVDCEVPYEENGALLEDFMTQRQCFKGLKKLHCAHHPPPQSGKPGGNCKICNGKRMKGLCSSRNNQSGRMEVDCH